MLLQLLYSSILTCSFGRSELELIFLYYYVCRQDQKDKSHLQDANILIYVLPFISKQSSACSQNKILAKKNTILCSDIVDSYSIFLKKQGKKKEKKMKFCNETGHKALQAMHKWENEQIPCFYKGLFI